MDEEMTFRDADNKYRFIRDQDGNIKDYWDDELLQGANPRCLWTDKWEYTHSGFGFVNRVAHYCSEIPVEEGVTIYITDF